MKTICIVDYGLGNLDSVQRALNYLGAECVISSDPEAIVQSEHVILPGVGAFGTAMRNLRERNLIEALGAYVDKGKPFLGICLGMQLLMDRSEELGVHDGLGFISGEVLRFPNLPSTYKVPHIGYCALNVRDNERDDTILEGVNPGEFVYFVHSFVVVPKDPAHILADTTYGEHVYCSAICKDQIWGTQFHPEKSGATGLRILKNFINL